MLSWLSIFFFFKLTTLNIHNIQIKMRYHFSPFRFKSFLKETPWGAPGGHSQSSGVKHLFQVKSLQS